MNEAKDEARKGWGGGREEGRDGGRKEVGCRGRDEGSKGESEREGHTHSQRSSLCTATVYHVPIVSTNTVPRTLSTLIMSGLEIPQPSSPRAKDDGDGRASPLRPGNPPLHPGSPNPRSSRLVHGKGGGAGGGGGDGGRWGVDDGVGERRPISAFSRPKTTQAGAVNPSDVLARAHAQRAEYTRCVLAQTRCHSAGM